MASSSSLLSEDQLQCSICLDVFTDPVTTPCGHNFCRVCLKECWDSSSRCQCPVCKAEFPTRPELSVNTFISGLAAQFKKSVQVKSSRAPETPAKPQVLCDVCYEKRSAALKSCLTCMASYCKTHLEPHQRVAILKKHKLMDPVENLENYICQKHERPLELFCRDDQTCVCQFCTETDHKTHSTVPIEEEIGEKKTQLGKTQAEVQQMIQDRLKKIEEIKQSVELNKKSSEKEKADGVEVFRALLHYIERSQAELLEVMEEKQKAAERQAGEFIKELEQEISELKRRDTELEQLSHTEDHLHLLQVYPSLCSPPPTKNWTEVRINSHLRVETLRRALSQLQEELRKEMEKLEEIGEYLLLILSDDGKQVRHGDKQQNLPDKPERFDCCVNVLGKEGFSSGRFYYEVQVSGKTEWDLGVTTESSNRKGNITLSPENGYWTVWLRNETEYKALEYPMILLSLKQAPQKVGVFVDYEEGLFSFYDVESRSHIYSFTEEERGEKKTQLGKTQVEVQQMIQDGLKKIEDIKQSVELNKKSSEKEKADSVEVFRALLRCIERSQAELLEVMEEKQKAAERQAEEFIKELEQEISELKRRDTELEQLSHTEDHLHLLQVYPSLCSPPPTKNWTEVRINSHLRAETLKRALTRLQEDLSKEMEKIDESEMQRLQQYAVDVTLDPDSAHPFLILSDDGKQLRLGDKRQNLPDKPERFDCCVNVLGKEGFSSGRFYYEVQVRGKTDWDLGVTTESSNRKGEITLSPENGYWTVWLRNETEYKALDSPRVPLSLKQAPQKVGVFVDYEEGLVSFYDVESRSHIYSFTGQSFTEKLYAYFSPSLNEGGDHKTHSTVPIEEESGEKKTQLLKAQAEVQQMIQNRLKKIEEIKQSVEVNKKSSEKEKADRVEVFRALLRCIERSQAELLEVMEEKQKAAERQAEEFIKELEQEITELKRRDTELEQLSHTEDHLHLLQVYPSLCSPPPTKNWTEVRINSHLRVEPLRRALTQLQGELSKEMEKLEEIEMKRIQQYAVDVTLDPDSAHPQLILSDDGKQVRVGDKRQNLPDKPERFDYCVCVLGKEGFSSGRFYYEVQVRGKTDWDLGVTTESSDRKGQIMACPEKGYWIVFLRNETEYEAVDSQRVPLSLKQTPQKVGVFVDYEEGLVSFFDVESRSHIYSFTESRSFQQDTTFSLKLLKGLKASAEELKEQKTRPREKKRTCHGFLQQSPTQLVKAQAEVQQMIQNRLKKIEEIKQSAEVNKKSSEKEKADSVEVFRALLRCIERSQAELLEVMEEKQKAAERQAEEFIKELEQEISELKRRDTELEQLSHTEDHLHLLQVYPSLCSPPPTKNWTEVRINSHLRVETLRRALTQLQEELSKEMEKVHESEMKRIQQYAVDVTLDPDSAHPQLILSDDGKQVRDGDKRQNLPDKPERFDRCPCVLGKEGFSSGRFYYEVQVSGKTKWDLGVTTESSSRKGQIIPSPKKGYWTLFLRNETEHKALDSPSVRLSLKQAPQKVGVFVDYEEGLVSFYGVESRSHIYSFTGQSFTEKLYPYFSPYLNKGGKNSAPLIITPVELQK
ncbi:hypothetical protein SRHO_G00030820 [Serrasalmus rhombeus]